METEFGSNHIILFIRPSRFKTHSHGDESLHQPAIKSQKQANAYTVILSSSKVLPREDEDFLEEVDLGGLTCYTRAAI